MMANHWIDRLARRLATDATTRRGVLRLGAGAGMALAGLGRATNDAGTDLTPDWQPK